MDCNKSNLYVDIQNIWCSFLNWACFNLAALSISGEKSDAGSKLLDHSNKVWRPIVKGKKVWGAKKKLITDCEKCGVAETCQFSLLHCSTVYTLGL